MLDIASQPKSLEKVPRSNSNRKARTTNKSFSAKSVKNNVAQRYISIIEYDFTPKVLHIQTGFKVTWVKDTGEPNDQHAIRFIGEEDKESPSVFGIGGSFTRIFTRPGKYEYYCERHVFMRGEIIVEGSQGRDNALEKSMSKQTKDSKQAAAPIDAESKYKEYMSKRQTAREKLSNARSQRDVEINIESDESKVQSPKIGEKSNESVAALVRFGSFDGESEDEESAVVRTGAIETVLNPRFGSFDDDLAENGNVIPCGHDPITIDQVEAEVFSLENSPEDVIRVSAFDCMAALEFLRNRWAADANDSQIKWI